MGEVKGSFEKLKPRFHHDKLGRNAMLVSNFMVTFNTNVRFNENDAELEQRSEPLYDMAQELFDGSDRMRRFVKFGTQGDKDPKTGKRTFIENDTQWDADTVVDYKITASVEVGHNSRGSRLHMHVGIKIRHHAYIRLDPDEIMEEANSYLDSVGFPYPIKHLNISVKPPSVEDYLNK